ncbi:MAG TPA: hypothetical protein VFN71_00595 [Methylomirabilota bacterium]|nr:hypothetical protein [Methylomirabilota bacterium]
MESDLAPKGPGSCSREPDPPAIARRRFVTLGVTVGLLAGSGLWARRVEAQPAPAVPPGTQPGQGEVPRAAPARPARGVERPGGTSRSTADYRVEVALLFGLLGFSVSGTVTEEVDHADGRYRVTVRGSGERGASRIDAAGIIRDGRFLPVTLKSEHSLAGRDSRLEVRYDHDRRRVRYQALWHTLLLGRRRQLDEVLEMPTGRPLDDAVSTTLNFMADSLPRDPDGTYQTLVVRRVRPEETDDVEADGYRVQIVPFSFRVAVDPTTGRLTALMDLARWSSWARADSPARVTFRPDRRPLSLESRLVLGSSIKARLE